MQLLALRTLELKTVAMFTSSLYMFCHKSKKLPVQQRKYRATSLNLLYIHTCKNLTLSDEFSFGFSSRENTSYVITLLQK
jgi:hypothetical protein